MTMPFCPVCRDEFEDWVKICPDDKAPLVKELPSPPENKEINEPLVLIATAPNEPIANMWSGVLADNDIYCLLKGENLGGGMYRRPLEPYQLYVLESEAKRARELLAPFIEGGKAD